MEKGSFHTSNPVAKTDELVKSIPLPNQLPNGIDFNDLPPHAIKSSALETLIQQNEDLMARLAVSLRRNGEYEIRIEGLEREIATSRARLDTLKEQYLVLQEKDRSAAQKLLQMHDDSRQAKSQCEKLEKLYADIFVQAQALQSRLQRAERNQARYRNAAHALKPFASEAKSLRNQVQSLKQTFAIQIDALQHDVETYKGKALERDQIYAERVRLENELVLEQRQFAQSQENNQTEIQNLTAESASLRRQLKDTLVSHEALESEVVELRQNVPQLKEQCQNLIEQVESLQSLWNHKQKEVEAAEERNRSLQKLNQNISVTLNQQRKEIQALKQELETERYSKDERIKTLLSEIQMLRRQLVEQAPG